MANDVLFGRYMRTRVGNAFDAFTEDCASIKGYKVKLPKLYRSRPLPAVQYDDPETKNVRHGTFRCRPTIHYSIVVNLLFSQKKPFNIIFNYFCSY